MRVFTKSSVVMPSSPFSKGGRNVWSFEHLKKWENKKKLQLTPQECLFWRCRFERSTCVFDLSTLERDPLVLHIYLISRIQNVYIYYILCVCGFRAINLRTCEKFIRYLCTPRWEKHLIFFVCFAIKANLYREFSHDHSKYINSNKWNGQISVEWS